MVARSCGPFDCPQEAPNNLAIFPVLNPNDADLADGRVAYKPFFDLKREDVLTTYTCQSVSYCRRTLFPYLE